MRACARASQVRACVRVHRQDGPGSGQRFTRSVCADTAERFTRNVCVDTAGRFTRNVSVYTAERFTGNVCLLGRYVYRVCVLRYGREV